MNVEKNNEEKCYIDPLIIQLSTRMLDICFAGCPHAKEIERRQLFLDGCFITNRLQIVYLCFIYFNYYNFIRLFQIMA